MAGAKRGGGQSVSPLWRGQSVAVSLQASVAGAKLGGHSFSQMMVVGGLFGQSLISSTTWCAFDFDCALLS